MPARICIRSSVVSVKHLCLTNDDSAMSTDFFDLLAETAPRESLQQTQVKKLRALLAVVLDSNPFYQKKFFDCGLRSADDVRSLSDMRRLPFTTKRELVADQLANPMFGTNLSYPLERFVKLHQTSGTTGCPLRWLDTEQSWQWWLRCWGAVYKAAGVSAGDRIFFAFGFGPFIGFWSAFESARLVGAMSIPGGGMSSEQRLQAILENQATVLVCTPTYVLHLADVARRENVDIAHGSIRVTIQAGEPGASIPSVRQRIEESWGAQCFDHTGATEVGATGFSCVARNGVHLNESEFIFEVIDPISLEPASAPLADSANGLVPKRNSRFGDGIVPQPESGFGEGELVVTNLGRLGMPAIRYRLGDIVRLDQATCECSRTYARMVGGIIGRADDMVTVRGVNVFPSAIDAIIRQFQTISEYSTEVMRDGELDELVVKIEIDSYDDASVAGALSNQIQRQLSLRPIIRVVPGGSLPRFELKARRFFDRRGT